ncbi:GNAT family N-acetyltransferase [Planomicrobium okeanokoites]|uniref:GNAT family N-acetyltransferase n=1 Tax=Planomicrobium okeanokoites TaxID=244 RepID=UPI003566D4B8
MEIRKATLADARGIARVHVDSWLATYKGIVPDAYLNQLNYGARERLWNENLKADNNFVAVNEDGEVIGFADGGKERTGKYAAFEGELYSIYILPQSQGQGIGVSLLRNVVDDIRQKGMNSLLVWVLADNRSRGFYEKFGGQEVDRKAVTISGKELIEIAYGWQDCRELKKHLT